MRVLIVGGGAAGLCCAIRLRQLDPAVQVTVLERLEQPGKKLLATGNGRCNLTNMQAPHSRAVLDFFASLGLMTRQEDLGRVYPYSLRAATVQNLLLDACRALGVRLVTGCRVEKIIPGFTVQTDKGAFAGDKVVVACGGGGIPVFREGNRLKGAAAVIDKDFAAELLAESLDADLLIILTAVEQVAINYRKENEQWLSSLTPEEAERYIRQGQCAPGSMLPKVRAAVSFAKTGGQAIIASLAQAGAAVRGEAGTVVHL